MAASTQSLSESAELRRDQSPAPRRLRGRREGPDQDRSPAGGVFDLCRVDVVLLSHDEHPDNLDNSGRALLADVPLTLTTPEGPQCLGDRARGLTDWNRSSWTRPSSGTITVTGVPAIHGPGAREDVEPVTGQVRGLVLTGEDLPTYYVSGDNASLNPVQEITERFGPIGTAILFAAAPRFPGVLFDGAPIVPARRRLRQPGSLNAHRVLPAHYVGPPRAATNRVPPSPPPG